MDNVIDKPEFQRLRRVSQTSYSPLYPSSSHNRFVHSLGVYHLGCLAADSLQESFKRSFNDFYNSNQEIYDRLFEVFKIACLLHDVGHAPFSHTLENLFSNLDGKVGEENLNKDLSSAVSEKNFKQDVKNLTKSNYAKPHEIMSAIIGIKSFNVLKNNCERAFFARCITGYKHSDISVQQNQIENILVDTLNSSIFDVDKIDYIIRDAYSSGYQTVNIDYHRFFSALRISIKNQTFVLALHKSAISVLENLVYAHDFERKWIQSHPRIIYESMSLENALVELTESFKEDKSLLFNENSLSKRGVKFLDRHIMLLSDDDIISLLKSETPNTYLSLCDRSNSKKSLWKSEGEYRACLDASVGSDSEINKRITNALSSLVSAIESEPFEIKEGVIEKLTHEIHESEGIEDDFVKKYNKDILLILQGFKEFSKKYKIDFDFEIVSSKRFKSNFTKEDLAKMLVCFDYDGTELHELNQISSIFKQSTSNQDFFYVFYKKPKGRSLSAKKLFDIWIAYFIKGGTSLWVRTIK